MAANDGNTIVLVSCGASFRMQQIDIRARTKLNDLLILPKTITLRGCDRFLVRVIKTEASSYTQLLILLLTNEIKIMPNIVKQVQVYNLKYFG